ncbi:MAG: (2Fe-2S)-binding protein [Microvirga sp.]|nr:(2Fe-2S)-binding protein [Microvirga sp.]
MGAETAQEERVRIETRVNGRAISAEVCVRASLVDWLRDELGLTGTHVGCEHGVCGACTIVVDDVCVRGCLMFAAQADGAHVETIEGATASGRLAALQEAFYERGALQCGFCTPGMLLTAAELLAREKNPDRERIRDELSGNYCRCTGYQPIVDAIEAVGRAQMEEKSS